MYRQGIALSLTNPIKIQGEKDFKTKEITPSHRLLDHTNQS